MSFLMRNWIIFNRACHVTIWRGNSASCYEFQRNLHSSRFSILRSKMMNPVHLSGDRGKLIVFEGLDRCGKSTQSRKLKEALEKAGESVELWSFPDRNTQLGGVINNYLAKKVEFDDRAIHLIFSANRWEKVPQLLKLLKSGTTVIFDRYAFSGVAYSAAKGLPLDWCRQPDVGLPQPDCVFFLQLDPEVIANRAGFGDERYEKAQFQEKVFKQFMKIKDEKWQVLDADQSVDDLHKVICEHVKSVEEEKVLKGLWTK